MKKYLDMFLTFFKIGAFTLGGGYAMVPLIEKEVVHNKKWIEQDEFIDMLALAQSSPGPIAVNVSVFVGYKVSGFIGCIVTILGSILPAFLIILAIVSVFTDFQSYPLVKKAFLGIRPAVVSLIVVPVINMIKNSKSPKAYIPIVLLVIFLVYVIKINPIIIIVFSAIVGIIFFKYKEVK
ncbi:chromate transporter [Hathewaya histolytica]|uniref:Chromate transport protein n=1 Tax=Hathewaya histolytica TaxID=1498 RepID=A0A4V6KDD1_HATHI|nr:chromate transporter [Hathewaya histolytica]VTQ83887.1 chromate transport protein [Hathewaya histolytica]